MKKYFPGYFSKNPKWGKNKNKHSNHFHAKYMLEKEPCVPSTELFVRKRVNWHFSGDRSEQSILDYHWKNRRHPIQRKLRAWRHFSKLTWWDMAIQRLKSYPFFKIASSRKCTKLSFIPCSICTYSQLLYTAWYIWNIEMNQSKWLYLRTLYSSVGAQWHQGTWLILVIPHAKALRCLKGRKHPIAEFQELGPAQCASCTVNEHIHITLSFLLRPLVEMGAEEPDYGMDRIWPQVFAEGGSLFTKS